MFKVTTFTQQHKPVLLVKHFSLQTLEAASDLGDVIAYKTFVVLSQQRVCHQGLAELQTSLQDRADLSNLAIKTLQYQTVNH